MQRVVIPNGTCVRLTRKTTLIRQASDGSYTRITFPQNSIRIVKDYQILATTKHICTLLDPLSNAEIGLWYFDPLDKPFVIATNEEISNYLYSNNPQTDSAIESNTSAYPLLNNDSLYFEAI